MYVSSDWELDYNWYGHFSFHLLVVLISVFCFILMIPCHVFTTKSNLSPHCRFYKSLPPISKAYGTACLLFTIAFQLGLYHPVHIALLYELVLSKFQVDLLTLVVLCYHFNFCMMLTSQQIYHTGDCVN